MSPFATYTADFKSAHNEDASKLLDDNQKNFSTRLTGMGTAEFPDTTTAGDVNQKLREGDADKRKDHTAASKEIKLFGFSPPQKTRRRMEVSAKDLEDQGYTPTDQQIQEQSTFSEILEIIKLGPLPLQSSSSWRWSGAKEGQTGWIHPTKFWSKIQTQNEEAEELTVKWQEEGLFTNWRTRWIAFGPPEELVGRNSGFGRCYTGDFSQELELAQSAYPSYLVRDAELILKQRARSWKEDLIPQARNADGQRVEMASRKSIG
ncbi:hypothetical protein R1sor_007481 [Riccia sorocarpa]|uniref:Uncharacterized protein n=1 Tax=Riccia sorocarpa TaxID=122646 RepID=A0ABD3HUS9_9MARC